MKVQSLIMIFLLLPAISMAQQADDPDKQKDIFAKIHAKSHGSITFEQDSVIRELVVKHILKNKSNPGIQGYRIRIYSDLGTHARKESSEYKTRFYEHFPAIPVYRDYVRPYYKVYVGDFRTKIEAIKSLKKIKRVFPSAFIVPDRINLPDLE
jgi:hypothetical protein